MRTFIPTILLLSTLIASCGPGKIEKGEDCEEIENCKELYLCNTSRNKAYNFVIDWNAKIIDIEYPFAYLDKTMSESQRKKIDEEIDIVRKYRSKGTDKRVLLPGEKIRLSGEKVKWDLSYHYKTGKLFDYGEVISHPHVLTLEIDYKIVGYLEINDPQ